MDNFDPAGLMKPFTTRELGTVLHIRDKLDVFEYGTRQVAVLMHLPWTVDTIRDLLTRMYLTEPELWDGTSADKASNR